MVGGVAHLRRSHRIKEQVSVWWHEAGSAVQSRRLPRARRFLRWILAYRPEDEDAWLWLAHLASTPTERLAYLYRAYAFHPKSKQVQVALRQVRIRQLESLTEELRPCPPRVRGLPDERQGSPGIYSQQDTFSRLNALPLLAKRRNGVWSLRHVCDLSTIDWAAWLAFLFPLLAYLLTACSTVYNLDSAEFSAAVHGLGIVRATGYPLYLLVGKIFTLILPVGDVAFRLNVMSALCAAGTVALLYHILHHLTKRRAAALAAGLLFAFSYYFWAQAVVAEVYTLHTLLMALLLLLLIRWEESRSDGLLAAFGLVFGLSFGNHMSTVLLIPAFAVFLLSTAGKELLRPKRLAMLLIPFVAGFGTYLYIPLRYLAQPSFNYVGHYDALGRFVPLDMTNPANLWWLVSGQGFQEWMFDYSLVELLGEAGRAAHRLWGNFLGIGLVPGLLGVWFQAKHRRHSMALFGLVFLANLVFFTNYRVVDKETMFIPVYFIWAVWIGEGFAWLVGWVQDRRALDQRRSPVWAWGLVALVLLSLVVNWPLVDIHADTRARDLADAALTQAGSGAIIFGWWTSAPPMHYLQIVENQRPDVLVINRFLIGADEMYALIDRSLGQRPVYVMELDEGLIGAYQPVPVGPMFELTPRQLAGTQP